MKINKNRNLITIILTVIFMITMSNCIVINAMAANSNLEILPALVPEENDMVLCADSAEELGVDVGDVALFSNDESYGDLNEYTLVSEHFIIDEKLYEYIPLYITPEKFNLFIERMDCAYEEMAALIGNKPCYGSKIKITHGGTGDYGYQWVYIGSANIYWNSKYIYSILTNISSNIDDWWFAGTMHELGHVFDDGREWVYDAEGSATYKAWMVMMKCNTTIHYGDKIYTRDSFIDYIETQTNEGVATIFNPVLKNYGFQYGWMLLQKVYGSYFDECYSVTFYKNINTTNSEDCIFVDFINRCSEFLGRDVKELWSEETKQQNQERFNNVEIDADIKVILYPKKARVGEKLKCSVYNIKESTIANVLLQRGSSWYNKHTNNSIYLHTGNNLNIDLGYTIDYESLGNSFIVNIDGVWSNWLRISNVEPCINLSNNEIRVGDTVGINFQYQWQSSLNGIDWSDILSATRSNYVATDDDQNKLLRCKMTDASGNVYMSYPSNPVKLFAAEILESNIGSYPKIAFQFTNKSEALNENTMHINLYIDNQIVDKIEVTKTEQPIGWVMSEILLDSEHIGKEMYAELYFESDIGYIGKVATPKITVSQN